MDFQMLPSSECFKTAYSVYFVTFQLINSACSWLVVVSGSLLDAKKYNC